MSDDLYPLYEGELDFIRRLGRDFALRHPLNAQQLGIDESGVHDPHVERMIEAFALLNARTRFKLEDDFPEIAQAFLGVLYPHYLAPIPAMGVVEFKIDREKAAGVTGALVVERGRILEAAAERVSCRFQTGFATDVWPIEVTQASVVAAPFKAPKVPRADDAAALLRIEVATIDGRTTFAELGLDRLRLYLNLSNLKDAAALYDVLLNNVLQIAVAPPAGASSPGGRGPVTLDPARLTPVGFERAEALLPESARSFPGYRLLTEFFAFPRKFLFVDLAGLSAARGGSRLEISFYLKSPAPDLEKRVSKGTLLTGCAPVINLFRHQADPFVLNQRQYEYRVIANAHREEAFEVYQVDAVTAVSPQGAARRWEPFYGAKHAVEGTGDVRYWHSRRAPRPASGPRDRPSGDETWLSFVDLSLRPDPPADWTILADTWCFNGDWPERIPVGGSPLHFADGGAEAACRFVGQPTRTRRREHGAANLWKLISHLSVNHLAIGLADGQPLALQEILQLYNPLNDEPTRNMILGIKEIRSRRGLARLPGPTGGFCRGLELDLVFDEDRFEGGGPYLFASVLDRFFGVLASINSYTRLRAATIQKQGSGEKWTWPPRSGDKPIL